MLNKTDQIVGRNKLILKRIGLSLVTIFPPFLGILILFLSKKPLTGTAFALSFFIAGFYGVIVIIRKEIPMALRSVYGKWAVIQGLSVTVFCWGSAIYFFLFGLK
ncbi:MAG: hypothetical protein IPJ46_11870 [Anaerolineales bacterium]|nr:hypothetical protein [Anaerolineales bacterium]